MSQDFTTNVTGIGRTAPTLSVYEDDSFWDAQEDGENTIDYEKAFDAQMDEKALSQVNATLSQLKRSLDRVAKIEEVQTSDAAPLNMGTIIDEIDKIKDKIVYDKQLHENTNLMLEAFDSKILETIQSSDTSTSYLNTTAKILKTMLTSRTKTELSKIVSDMLINKFIALGKSAYYYIPFNQRILFKNEEKLVLLDGTQKKFVEYYMYLKQVYGNEKVLKAFKSLFYDELLLFTAAIRFFEDNNDQESARHLETYYFNREDVRLREQLSLNTGISN